MKNKKTQIEKEHKKDRKKRMIPKRKLQNGLKLQNNRQEIRLDLQALSVKESNYLAIRIVLTFLASVSVLFCCFSAFQVKVSLIVTAVPALVMAVISQILFLRKKSGWIGGTGMAIVIAVLSVILLNSVSNGFSAIANDVLRSVNKNMAMANLMFVVNEDSLVADEYIASIILSLLVTFVFAIFIRFHLNPDLCINVFRQYGRLYLPELRWWEFCLLAISKDGSRRTCMQECLYLQEFWQELHV